MTKIRVCAVQAAPVLFDQDATISRFEQWLAKAADQNADLVVFPEAFLGGYPKGEDFGAHIGSRSQQGRALFQRYFETSFDPYGFHFSAIKDIIARHKVNVVVGIIEPEGGTLYCSTATIDRAGNIIGWHRKLMPTATERLIWGFGDARTLKVADADIGIISSAICWENYMPLYRQHLYNQGAEFYCVSTVDDRPVWLPSMQMIALEGRCFVISACQYMTRKDVSSDSGFRPMQGDDPDSILINGGSCIISPLGEILVYPIFGKTTLVTADLDKGEIIRGKFDLDVAGHYARHDIFKMSVNDGNDASR